MEVREAFTAYGKKSIAKEVDPFEKLPEEYWVTGDLPLFMRQASRTIVGFCRGRLHYDADVISDFYVYFYERAHICLQRYKKRRNVPFRAYLKRYLRHEFYNYMRVKRLRLLKQYATPDGSQGRHWISIYNRGDEDGPLHQKLVAAIGALPIEIRMSITLYYGLPLGLAELRFLADRLGVERARLFLAGHGKRREIYRARLMNLQNRSAYLNYMIRTAGQAEKDQKRMVHWQRWKRKVDASIVKSRHAYSLAEISELLGLSKTTIARRIQRAEKIIQQEGVWS